MTTDWIPGYDNKNERQSKAVNSLINEIKRVPEKLRSMGLGNIEIIIGETSDELARDMAKKIARGNIGPFRTVIIASKAAVESGRFRWLTAAAEDEGAFLVGIDPAGLKCSPSDDGKPESFKIPDIDILEMLALAMELATGKEPPSQHPLIASYDKTARQLILLPRAVPKSDGEILESYKRQWEALKSA
jgi:hypothetical protein